MTQRYVVDSSVYASVVVKDEFYERAREFIARQAGSLITLDLALVEVGNVLWKHAFVLRRISEDRYRKLKGSVKPLITTSSQVHSAAEILEEAMDNAAELGITVYDSLYVTLALQTGQKLVTFDEELQRRLRAKGLELTLEP